jgi:ribosome-binding ATPase YchF (GTP1/OBG family)
MKIGLVGYQGSGKSLLFGWLTGVAPDPALAHCGQSAMAPVPDARVQALAEIYKPKKITLAALEIVDTPGLSRDHEGNPARLALIREVGCLVLVVATFAGSDPLEDLRSFEEDLLLADMEVLSGRIERLRESLKKPRPTREKEQAELALLEPLLADLEQSKALRDRPMSEEEKKAISSFRLLTQKPKLIVLNLADDDDHPERFASELAGQHYFAARIGLEAELATMNPDERASFEQEFGLSGCRRDELLRMIMDVSNQLLYFTAGEKEVRTWMLPRGGTALDAAANIHTDLARGFIRAETMRADDLIRLGSEREVKAHNLLRQEPKDYVVQDGDVLHIRFSV